MCFITKSTPYLNSTISFVSIDVYTFIDNNIDESPRFVVEVKLYLQTLGDGHPVVFWLGGVTIRM